MEMKSTYEWKCKTPECGYFGHFDVTDRIDNRNILTCPKCGKCLWENKQTVKGE